MLARRSGSICRFLAIVVLIFVNGCSSAPDEQVSPNGATSSSDESLRVLLVDDEELGAVITRQWRANADSSIEVQHTTAAAFVQSEQQLSRIDVVIYPAGLLGELAERNLIQPLPDEFLRSPETARDDILPLDRRPLVSWGDSVYAVSLGSPQLVLMYRADIFQKLNLEPPKSWLEYQQLADRLADRKLLGDLAPPDAEPWTATAEPLADGWAGQLLLARAAAYVRHPSSLSSEFHFITMKPLIDREPFVRALNELAAASKAAGKVERTLTPHEAFRRLLDGHCAMAIGWPSRESDNNAKADDSPQMNVGFTPLPGAIEVFNFTEQKWMRAADNSTVSVPLLGVDGRLCSVSRNAAGSRTAFRLIALLTGREQSTQVAPQSRHTTMFRASHLSQPLAWTDSQLNAESARSYAAALDEIHMSTIWLHSIRIPGRDRYLSELDRAVNEVLDGKATSNDALSAAAKRWDEITAVLGTEAQRKAYMRSLEREP